MGLVTPVPAKLARELVESLINEVVVTDTQAAGTFSVRPIGLAESIRRSLAATCKGQETTSFVDTDLTYFAPAATDPEWSGGTVFRDVRTVATSASPAEVYAAVSSVGGEHGWFGSQLLWEVRGVLDLLIGGPGLRRGRRNPTALEVGDPVDFWRVEAADPRRRLRLHAEMRLPGDAWLTWELVPSGGGGTLITQTAEFRPAACSAASTGWPSLPSTVWSSRPSSVASLPNPNRAAEEPRDALGTDELHGRIQTRTPSSTQVHGPQARHTALDAYQPALPEMPLNGPARSAVTQPP